MINQANIPVVILCGGKGRRMGREDIPKPMFKIGSKPLLWHVMKYYECCGFRNFILLLGYKKEKIKKYFSSHNNWNIKFVDTGLDTNTGGRIKRIENLIKQEIFFATYGDGLANINLKKLLSFHLEHNKIATLTSVRPLSQFGIVSIDSHSNIVKRFEEKPVLDHWVNGGFFVFNRQVFKYLKSNDVLERETIARIIDDNQLAAYRHKGFWECMDTYKDNLRLNQLWDSGDAPWAVWQKKGR